MFEQEELLGMPSPLYACTPTRLATWRDCPRRYRFTYLDRPQPPKGPPWAHNSVGAAVHSALADWWSLPLPRRTPEAGAAGVRRRWLTEGFRDLAQAGAARERAAAWVHAYLGRLDPAREPIGVERTVSVTTGRLALSGRADRLDDRDGALVVVDYKTGRHVPDAEDARTSLALAVYAVAGRRTLRRPAGRVELHHLPSATVAVAEHSAADLDAAVAEAERIGTEAQAADAAHARGDRRPFAPVPAARCRWCDYRRHCPEGRAAAPDVQPWAGLFEPPA